MNSYTPPKPRFWIRPCYTAVSSVRECNEYKFRPYLIVITDMEFLAIVSTIRPTCLICSPYMHTIFDRSSMRQFHSKAFHSCHCCQSFSLSKCYSHSTLLLHCEILLIQLYVYLHFLWKLAKLWDSLIARFFMFKTHWSQNPIHRPLLSQYSTIIILSVSYRD